MLKMSEKNNHFNPMGIFDKEVKPISEKEAELRDYFAAAALQGFLANPSNEFVKFHEVASDACNTADQMLAARKEGA